MSMVDGDVADLPAKFDILLVEVNSKENDDGPVLVRFLEIEELAKQKTITVPSLPVSALQKFLSIGGRFCIKSHHNATFDTKHTSLAEYVANEEIAVRKSKNGALVSIYWKGWQAPLMDSSSVTEPKHGNVITARFDLGKTDKNGEVHGTAGNTPEDIKLSDIKSESHPEEMTAKEWASVLDTNQVLKGVYVDNETTEILDGIFSSKSGQDLLTASQSAGGAGTVPAAQTGKASETPAPQTSAPQTPAPETPAPKTEKALEAPAPEVPAPEVSAPEVSAPEVSAPEVPAPEAPVPKVSTTDAEKASGVSGPDPGKDATENPDDQIDFFTSSPRAAFIIHPKSSMSTVQITDGQDASDHNDIDVEPFWCHPRVPSTTLVTQAKTLSKQWSLVSGYDKSSFGLGLSAKLQGVAGNGKLGFDSERNSSHYDLDSTTSESCIAIHEIPIVEMTLNPATLQLSHSCVQAIKRIRNHRDFQDLKIFYKSFGTVFFQRVILGGRLLATRKIAENEKIESISKQFKSSVNASVGIAEFVNAQGSQDKGELSEEQMKQGVWKSNVVWSATGGEPAYSVDPSKWRTTVWKYQNWKAIKQENPILLEKMIGECDGFSDVPGLFEDIRKSGILDRSVLSLPPMVLSLENTGGKELTKPLSLSKIKLGQAIEPATGRIVHGYEDTDEFRTASKKQATPKVTSGGISWRVIQDSRDVKTEIAAQLQINLNAIVNLNSKPQYLEDLRASKTSFSVVFKWTSDALQFEMSQPEFAAAVPVMSSDPSTASFNPKYIFAGFTERAWIIGVWSISQLAGSKPETFFELRLKAYRFFSDPRGIAEGCDFFRTALTAAKGVTECKFKMYATDRVLQTESIVTDYSSELIKDAKGNLVSQSVPIDPFRTYDFIERHTRLGNTLRYRATIYAANLEAGTSTTPWQPTESALLRLQAAWRSLIFLKTKLSSVYAIHSSKDPIGSSVSHRVDLLDVFFNDPDKRRRTLEGDLEQLDEQVVALDSLHSRVCALLKEDTLVDGVAEPAGGLLSH